MKNYCSEKRKTTNNLQEENILLQKKLLRKNIRDKLNIFFEKENVVQDETKKIETLFLSSNIFNNAENILIYTSSKYEVETINIIKKSLSCNKKVFLPRITNRLGSMDFHCIQNINNFDSQFTIGEYGIKEPLSTLPKIDVSHFPPSTLVVMPGLAFSKSGKRLGKGKGFYDKYFASVLSQNIFTEQKKIIFVALCFSVQITENIPMSKCDLPVDYLFSSNFIF